MHQLTIVHAERTLVLEWVSNHTAAWRHQSRKKTKKLPAVPQGAFGGLQGRWDTGVERVGCEGRAEIKKKNQRDQGRREWMSILPLLTPERPLSSLARQANGQLARRRCDTPFPAHQPRQMSPLPPPSRAPATSWPHPPPKTIQERGETVGNTQKPWR